MKRTRALPWLLGVLGATVLVAAGQMMPWGQWLGSVRALLAPDTVALQETLATDRRLAAEVPALRAKLQQLPKPMSGLGGSADPIGFLGSADQAAGASGVRITSSAFGATTDQAGVRALSVTLGVEGSMAAQGRFVQMLEHGSRVVHVQNWSMTGQGGQIALNLLYH